MKREIIFAPIGLLCLILIFISGTYIGRTRGIPFVGKYDESWSIAIYTGESPFKLTSPINIDNPVLTAKDVTDVTARFIADPFMIKNNSSWYMFFEVMNVATQQGDIGLATSSDGFNWIYQQIVLDEDFHLSFPSVFQWNKEYYMIPESHEVNSIRLYKAVDFPLTWAYVGTLLDKDYYLDPTIFHYDNNWWIFAGTNPGSNDILRLFYAQHLFGSWTEHPASPIVIGDPNVARPAGRVLLYNDRIFRYAQDDHPTYGNQVRMFEITQLTPVTYREKEVIESPILIASGTGWNARGMHHIDAHQVDENLWIACVDGYRDVLVFGFKY